MFVKICGTTSEDDALLAVALGADAVGFVFAPSPRQVAPQLAADIVKRLPPEIVSVGVFRNEMRERVLDIAQRSGLRAAQLHGREPPDDSRWLRSRLPMVIRAFSAGDPAVRNAGEHGADVVLIDAASPGSGRVFDWALAAEVPAGQRLMVAGGLDPSNVGAAIAQTRPWGVDVVTGVESEPGRKDPIKLRDFMAAVRAAEEQLAADRPELTTSAGAPAHEVFDWQEDT